MSQSKDLTKFYQDYLDWVENGAINEGTFTTQWGLCTNLSRWCDERIAKLEDLYPEMLRQFEDAGLNLHYPFNNSANPYAQHKHHLNETRMKWVREHAER